MTPSSPCAAWDHFAQGFLVDQGEGQYGFLGRIAGIVEDDEGSLLFADDFNGIVYRISYGDGGTETAEVTPPDVMPKPEMSDLAINLVAGEATLKMTASFAPNELMPIKQGADGHNASPMLSWSGAPEGTRSFVLIADDPDADAPKPLTHWVAYDIQADVESLREGLPGDPILQEPKGALQGKNSKGQLGYLGPRPPLGDPAHHYHFQIFATDLATLSLPPGASRAEVLAALDGHVLAKGEIVSLYQRPAPERPAN